jgi:hypothetical protein
MKSVIQLSLISAVICFSVLAQESEAASRHNEGGSVGPNGVKQSIAIKINKLQPGKDIAYIQVDLGEHRYDSAKPEALITTRPVILVTIGSVPTMIGVADKKARIISEQFTGKLVNNGAGLRIQIKKGALTNLLSDFSGHAGHGTLTITIQDNHAPSTTAAQARHSQALFSAAFEIDIVESTKFLIARGG